MFKILDEVCKPTRESENNMFVDLYARENCVIGAGETILIGLGVAIDLNKIKEHIPDYEEVCKYYKDMMTKRQLSKIKAMQTRDYIIEENLSIFLKKHYLQLELHKDLKIKGLISTPESVSLDYQDEIKLIVHNPIREIYYDNITDSWDMLGAYCKSEITKGDNSYLYKIKKGDKVAQVVLMEHKTYLLGTEIEKEEKD